MTIGLSVPVAPLGRRMVAFVLDGFVLVPIWIAYTVVFDAVFGPLVAADPGGTGVVVVAVDPLRMALELALTLVTDAAYYAGSWARWGTTPGQRACRVVVRAVQSPTASVPGERAVPGLDSGRVPVPVASVRWAALQLLPLCVGSLGTAGALPIGIVAGVTAGWSGFLLVSAVADPMRRGFHDRVAGTVVLPAPRPGS